jgi:regulator of cell morphogenesis and NO signaling
MRRMLLRPNTGGEALHALQRSNTHRRNRRSFSTLHGWTFVSLTELVNHILSVHHSFTRREFARLSPLMDRVINVHGLKHPELFEIEKCFRELAADLESHMLKEEKVLFPYLLSLDRRKKISSPFGFLESPIKVMESEHETAGDLLSRIRSLSKDFEIPAEVCGSYRSLYVGLLELEADLHHHIHLENNILFPKALKTEAARRVKELALTS